MNTTIQIRVNKQDKNNAKKVLDLLGLDMSTAIKLYLKQISIHNGIPFQILTENGLTIREENEILQAAKEARTGEGMSGPKTPKQALKYLDLL